ncbi:hypothetical protein GH714_006461 [Hevea brasiliensis]|uniref:Cytochrome P450 n=1 Tax=Hevea brasiliensis TaxID=3981 RepID=A0A6A6MC49_HEVBR|nr:hypothetical protein GH714_006461 [Hevea brasiliensis]
MNNSIDLKGQDFELIPFGAARRICPGLLMGLTTVEVSLANLLYKFDWKMPVGMKKEDLDMDAQPVVLFLFLLKKNNTTKKYHLPPGPKGLPIIGNLHQLYFSIPHKRIWELSKNYGPIMTLRMGTRPAIVVTSAKLAKDIMKTYDLNFCSRPALVGSHKLSYNGLDVVFSPYDDYWREIRKITVVHLFNSIRSSTFRPIREDEVSRLVNNISKSAAASKPFNLSEAMLALGNNVTIRAATGKRCDVEDRLTRLVSETQAMFAGFFFSDYIPCVGKIIDRLSGLLRRLNKNFSEFDVLYQDIIDEHLQAKAPKSECENLVEVLIKLYKENAYKIQLTFDHLKAILMNVFIAGTDTSASAVVWAMAMVRETMRLEPAAPMLVPRETIADCKLGGYDIPAKSIVYVNNWAVGRDPEAWENPLEFRPERLLESGIDVKGNDYELTPFGAGRRICPGYFMGMSNVELSLANFLYRFDWEMPPGMKADDIDFNDVRPGIVVHKKHNLLLMAKDYLSTA